MRDSPDWLCRKSAEESNLEQLVVVKNLPLYQESQDALQMLKQAFVLYTVETFRPHSLALLKPILNSPIWIILFQIGSLGSNLTKIKRTRIGVPERNTVCMLTTEDSVILRSRTVVYTLVICILRRVCHAISNDNCGIGHIHPAGFEQDAHLVNLLLASISLCIATFWFFTTYLRSIRFTAELVGGLCRG